MGMGMDSDAIGVGDRPLATGNGNGNAGARGGRATPTAPTTSARAGYQRLADANRGTGGESLANFLGFFSLGLGLAEFRDAGRDGARRRRRTTRTSATATSCGSWDSARSTHGFAILSNQQPAKAVWSRVAGDALDLSLLGRTLANPKNDRGRTLFATANVLAVTALDRHAREAALHAAEDAGQRRRGGRHHPHEAQRHRRAAGGGGATRSGATSRTCRASCATSRSVTVTGENRSHWVAKAPAGQTVEWDAETTERPAQRARSRGARWRARTCTTRARVRFAPAPGGRGTEVRVDARVRPTVRQARAPRWRCCSARSRDSRCRTTCATSSRSWRSARSCSPTRRSSVGCTPRSRTRSPCTLISATLATTQRPPGACRAAPSTRSDR